MIKINLHKVDYNNTIDKYKFWENDLIKEDLKKRQFPFAIMMSHLHSDYNIGSVVRSANVFGALKVYYYGNKRTDKRSFVGSHHYTDVIHLNNFDEILKLKEIYYFVALEQDKRSVPLPEFQWPKDKKILILVGEESCGLTKEVLDLCDTIVEIPQFGSIRSLNAASSASIVMYDYISKFNRPAHLI